MKKEEFDKWAGCYDSSIMSGKGEFPFDGYFDVISAMVSIIGPRKNMKVLDVGIGTGRLAGLLSRTGCDIYGIDFSEEMLAKAKERIPEGKFEIVDVAKDYLGQFSRFRFDRVVSSYFLHHFDSSRQLDFIRRILDHNLNKDGSLVIGDIGFADIDAFRKGYEKYRNSWDSEEFYLCGEKIITSLSVYGFSAEYTQISSCAGILVCRRK